MSRRRQRFASTVRSVFLVSSILPACPAAADHPNRPPILTPLAARYPIRAGTRESLAIEATDPDQDPLTFRLIRGPSYVSVITVDPGKGVARGSIEVAPDSCARNDVQCVIEVSDGFAADSDSMTLVVYGIGRPVPKSPMIESGARLAGTEAKRSSHADATRLVGEWEWRETSGGGLVGGITTHAKGMRLVFHPGGRLELLEIGPDQIVRARSGTYQFAPDGTALVLSAWFDGDHPVRFAASMDGPSTLRLYPWMTVDAAEERFVRVPRVTRGNGNVDSSGIIAPLEPPRIRFDHGRTRISLSEAMAAALRRCDPDFRLWSEDDSRALRHGLEKGAPGPSAIVGDFDGDLLPDVALLGRSGADQVVIAIVSHYGNVQAAEVAWRRARIGDGEDRSRGDPRQLVPVYLELAPRGSLNPYCWATGRTSLPLDGIGIVVPGARFDYVLSDGRFVLHGPRS